MKRIGFAVIAALFVSQTANAGAAWSTISIVATPSNAAQVVAATDKLMNSEVGKTFPGKLLLQVNVADGANAATHTFVPIYKTAAQREAFAQSLQGSTAWTEFQAALEKTTQPGGTVMHQTLKRWGDINDTDHVWMVHAFDVSDPAGFVAALDALMASETGKKFPGQVYLSTVVAGGTVVVRFGIAGADTEVVAGGSVFAKFINGARVRAGDRIVVGVYIRGGNVKVDREVCVAGGARVPGMVEALGRRMNVETHLVNPFERGDHPDYSGAYNICNKLLHWNNSVVQINPELFLFIDYQLQTLYRSRPSQRR